MRNLTFRLLRSPPPRPPRIGKVCSKSPPFSAVWSIIVVENWDSSKCQLWAHSKKWKKNKYWTHPKICFENKNTYFLLLYQKGSIVTVPSKDEKKVQSIVKCGCISNYQTKMLFEISFFFQMESDPLNWTFLSDFIPLCFYKKLFTRFEEVNGACSKWIFESIKGWKS